MWLGKALLLTCVSLLAFLPCPVCPTQHHQMSLSWRHCFTMSQASSMASSGSLLRPDSRLACMALYTVVLPCPPAWSFTTYPPLLPSSLPKGIPFPPACHLQTTRSFSITPPWIFLIPPYITVYVLFYLWMDYLPLLLLTWPFIECFRANLTQSYSYYLSLLPAGSLPCCYSPPPTHWYLILSHPSL